MYYFLTGTMYYVPIVPAQLMQDIIAPLLSLNSKSAHKISIAQGVLQCQLHVL